MLLVPKLRLGSTIGRNSVSRGVGCSAARPERVCLSRSSHPQTPSRTHLPVRSTSRVMRRLESVASREQGWAAGRTPLLGLPLVPLQTLPAAPTSTESLRPADTPSVRSSLSSTGTTKELCQTRRAEVGGRGKRRVSAGPARRYDLAFGRLRLGLRFLLTIYLAPG